MIENLLNMGIKDFRVLDAISQVPRHIFIDEALWSRAYENRSLTIGYKQTISQPYIVAKMTELLISHTKDRGKIFNNVLELYLGETINNINGKISKFKFDRSDFGLNNLETNVLEYNKLQETQSLVLFSCLNILFKKN